MENCAISHSHSISRPIECHSYAFPWNLQMYMLEYLTLVVCSLCSICIVIDNEQNVQELQVENKNTMDWSYCLFTIPRTKKKIWQIHRRILFTFFFFLQMFSMHIIGYSYTNKFEWHSESKIPNAFPVTSLSHIFNTFFLFLICNAIYWAECLNNNQEKTGNEKNRGECFIANIVVVIFFFCSLSLSVFRWCYQRL